MQLLNCPLRLRWCLFPLTLRQQVLGEINVEFDEKALKYAFLHCLFLVSFSDQCTVTRTYLFLHKFWFFSTIYYFGNWAFIAVSPRLHTFLRMAGECTHLIFPWGSISHNMLCKNMLLQQICKGFSLIQNHKGGSYYIHTRYSRI